MPTRRTLITAPAALAILSLHRPVVGHDRQGVLAVPLDASAPAAVAPMTLLRTADPIAALLDGRADLALDGHRHWRAMPAAIVCFGGLPGGLPPADRDAWLSSPEGRGLWDVLHARHGLAAVPVGPSDTIHLTMAGRPGSLQAAGGLAVGADAPLWPFLRDVGIGRTKGGRPTGGPDLFTLPGAGPPVTLTARLADVGRTPTIAADATPAAGAPVGAVPVEWAVALVDAAVRRLDRLAASDDPLDRATVAAFRSWRASVSRTPPFG